MGAPKIFNLANYMNTNEQIDEISKDLKSLSGAFAAVASVKDPNHLDLAKRHLEELKQLSAIINGAVS